MEIIETIETFKCAACEKTLKTPRVNLRPPQIKRGGIPIKFPGTLCKDHLGMLYHFNKMYQHGIKEDHANIVEFIKKEGFKSVAELGCGAGLFYKEYGAHLKGVEYSGFDIRPSVLAMARVYNPGISFTELNLYKRPPPQSFDLLFTRHVIRQQEDLERFLRRSLLIGKTVVHIDVKPFSEIEETTTAKRTIPDYFGEKLELWANIHNYHSVDTICKDLKVDYTINENWIILRNPLLKEEPQKEVIESPPEKEIEATVEEHPIEIVEPGGAEEE